jgi:hypothetical protein
MGLVACKGKTEQASASGDAAPSAQPSPSASTPPATTALSSLMGFEGQIDLVAQSGSPEFPKQGIAMYVKDDRIRLDSIPGTDAQKLLGPKGFLLLLVQDKKLDIVSEAKKHLIELDLNNTEALKTLAKEGAPPAPPGKRAPHPAEPPKLNKTGKKEMLAGYPCEDWEITEGKDRKKASICMADLKSSFFHLPLTSIPSDYGFAGEMLDGQHFPLRVVSYDERTGAESGRLEVIKFDPHPLDAAKFTVPADYEKVDAMQLFGSLSAGGRPDIPGIPSNLPIPPPHSHHHH